jgi:SAM-dependent methyltransferase|tara:strand:+ start:607 stop:1110 length:504 start_codon:yes stop_codon:yes gene_type:complete
MRATAIEFMRRFVEEHLKGKKNLNVLVLSKDSEDHKELVEFCGHTYHSSRAVEGEGIPVDDSSFDIVATSSFFYSTNNPNVAIARINRLLKDEGLLCIVTPSTGSKIKTFTVESLSKLVGKELDILSCELPKYGEGLTIWNDIMCVAMKIDKKKKKKKKNSSDELDG